MADLTDIQAAESVKIIGSSSAGVESTPVNATSNGALHSNLRNDAGTEIGFLASTGTITSVAASITSVTLLASNTNRRGFIIYNDSNATCYVAFAATASATAFTKKLGANESWEYSLVTYTGQMTGIWNNANGSMRITELT